MPCHGVTAAFVVHQQLFGNPGEELHARLALSSRYQRGNADLVQDSSCTLLIRWVHDVILESFDCLKLSTAVVADGIGAGGDAFDATIKDTKPTTQVRSLKTAWTTAKKAARVAVRWHDLRHTCVTRYCRAARRCR